MLLLYDYWKRILLRHHWQKQLEADKRLDDLCKVRGKEVAVLYGQGLRYDVLEEVRQMLEGDGGAKTH